MEILYTPKSKNMNKTCNVCKNNGPELSLHLKQVENHILCNVIPPENMGSIGDGKSSIQCSFCLIPIDEYLKSSHFCFHRVAEEIVFQDDNILKCIVCNSEFTKEKLVTHMLNCCTIYPRSGSSKYMRVETFLKKGKLIKVGEVDYQCTSCKSIFNINYALKHVRTCSFSKKCNICDLTFSDSKDLNEHCSNTKYSAIHFCFQCVLPCTEEHKKKCEGEQKSFCTVCHNVLNYYNLQAHRCFHIFTEEEILNYRIKDDFLYCTCPYCNKKVPREFLKKHVNWNHLESMKNCPCLVCYETFNNVIELINHEKIHSNFLCYICGKTNIKCPNSHIQKHKDNGKKYQCDQCPKVFSVYASYKRHLMVHIEQGEFVCDTCNKRFKTTYNLKVHKRIHDAVKPFECSLCLKTFQTKQARDKHLVTHQALFEELLIKCQKCEEIFQTEVGFKNHMENIEAFLKVYCKRCGKFIRFEESIFHLEVTHSCSLCKLILEQNTFLYHKCFHEKSAQTKAKNLKVRCKICDKAFFIFNDVTKHVKENHSGIMKTFCQCCNLNFNNETAYARHFKTVHPKILRSSDVEKIRIKEVFSLKFSCDRCPSQFDSNKEYKEHKCNPHDYCHNNTHDKEMKYSNLKVHIERHEHVKLFECLICRKSLATKQLRDEHSKLHKKNNSKKVYKRKRRKF